MLKTISTNNPFITQSWYKKWSAIQELGLEEYSNYCKNGKENSPFRFLSVTEDVNIRFQYAFRAMIIKKHPFLDIIQGRYPDFSYDIKDQKNIGFGYSPAFDSTSTIARPLLCSEFEFRNYCKEFGISEQQIEVFINMPEPDWNNF